MRSDILTRETAATYLGVSVQTLDRMTRCGNGPVALRMGRLVRYKLSDLDDWIDSCRSIAIPSPNTGGAASTSTAVESVGRLARETAERLRLKSAGCGLLQKPRHLIAVPEDA